MWSLSSLRKLSSPSSSLIDSYGGLKRISYMSSKYAPAFSGSSDHAVRGESEKGMFNSSPNYGMNRAAPAARQRFAGQNDFGIGRISKPMDFVRGIIERDNSQFSRHNVERNPHVVFMNMKRNNTFINVLDSKGNTKFRAASGFKEIVGAGKVSRYAAEATAEFVGRKAREMGLKSVVMRVKGFTYFKKKRQAIMSFREGFSNSPSDQSPIVYIEDVTRRPHNGCRLPKKRRI